MLRGKGLGRAMDLGLEMHVDSSRTVSEQLGSEGYPSEPDHTFESGVQAIK